LIIPKAEIAAGPAKDGEMIFEEDYSSV